MTKRQTKRGAGKKKMKDLDPKAKGKGVKGGATSLGTHLGRIGGHVGDAVNDTGGAFNNALNPR
jgi:hypothetical protein